MSPDTTNTDPVVLLVSDLNDADVSGCLDRLRDAGIPIERTQSVYAAAADLALRRNIRHILLDIRSLDDKEMAFHRLIKRSYPDTSVIVPVFRGTGERAATYGPGIRPTPLDSLTEELCEEYGVAATARPQSPETRFAAEEEQAVAEAESMEVADQIASDDTGLDASNSAYEEDDVAADEAEEAAREASQVPYPAEESAFVPTDDDFEELSPESSPPALNEVPLSGTTAPIDTVDDAPADAPAAAEESPDAYRTVRDKLAGELRSAAQRTPPRTPPGFAARDTNPTAPQPERPASMLSPEEMDALMTNPEDEPRDENDEGDGA